jgi:hypothetical protein
MIAGERAIAIVSLRSSGIPGERDRLVVIAIASRATVEKQKLSQGHVSSHDRAESLLLSGWGSARRQDRRRRRGSFAPRAATWSTASA